MSYLASLSLFPATPEQIIESRKRTCVQWAKNLTEEEYLKRDAIMELMEHSAKERLTTWVLAPRNIPGTLDFKCSCETYLRKGLMCDATGKLSEVSCYGIASVFTPAAWRGRGYAKHMMRLLHWVLGPSPPLPQFPREWGETPTHSGLAQFSALYSDIGEFYAHCGPSQEGAEGWLIKSAFSTAWMLDDLPLRPAEYSTRTNEWKWLDISGVEKIWNEDVQWMKHDIIQSVKSTGRTSFAFLPTDGVGTFQIHRSNFTAPNIPAINKWGIFLEDNLEDKARTFATWAVEWQTLPTTLIITRLRASTKRFPALMEYILDAAKEYGAQKVEVWNIPYDLENVAIGLGGRTSERKEHLPAFKWYGSDKNEEVEWLFNEK